MDIHLYYFLISKSSCERMIINWCMLRVCFQIKKVGKNKDGPEIVKQVLHAQISNYLSTMK